MRFRVMYNNILLLTMCSILGADSYRILLASPMSSKSIHKLITTIGKNLVNANHTVVVMSTFDSSFSHPNFEQINILVNDIGSKLDENMFECRTMAKSVDSLARRTKLIGDEMWANPTVWRHWTSRNSYDAILIPSYANEIALPFLLNYTGSFIMLSLSGVEYIAMTAAGNWLPPAVVPALLLPFDEHMSFLERCINLLMLVFLKNYPFEMVREHERRIQKHFPDFGTVASYYERSVLTLINGHPALDSPVPLLPNQVEIGTIIANLPRPLPEDLEEFVSSSGSAGVIYFSIGTLALGKDIPSRAKGEFVKAFRRLPQKVVWKYEGTDLNLPPNVITRPWLPQQDLLGHPKTRLFISHCGNLGTQEAKYHGVPVLAVPVNFDQPRNAARMVRKGYALSLEWDTLTEDSIVEAVNQLINDTSYSERLLAVSKILKDQKESPGERAVWWIEHVIRHKGAPYLQYPGKRLHFLQYISADVILFFTLLIFAFWRLLKYVIKLSYESLTNKAKKLKTQ